MKTTLALLFTICFCSMLMAAEKGYKITVKLTGSAIQRFYSLITTAVNNTSTILLIATSRVSLSSRVLRN